MSLWRAEPLVLASKSSVRRALLEAAGIPLTIEPAAIAERAIESSKAASASAANVALLLAREKALEVARRRSKSTVLGADQTLALGARRFSKPANALAAREQLKALSGKTHELHAAVAVAQGGEIVFETVATARLTVRPLSESFLDAYLAAAGERVSSSVGAYQLERLGVHLFERVEGDHFTILGLPLLPLLAYFRSAGLVAS
jgi:nucleoside triphosphate pyrophosphatase